MVWAGDKTGVGVADGIGAGVCEGARVGGCVGTTICVDAGKGWNGVSVFVGVGEELVVGISTLPTGVERTEENSAEPDPIELNAAALVKIISKTNSLIIMDLDMVFLMKFPHFTSCIHCNRSEKSGR